MRFNEGFTALCILTRHRSTVGNHQERKEWEGGNVAGIRKTDQEVPLSFGRRMAGLHSAARQTNRFTGTSGNQVEGRGGRVRSERLINWIHCLSLLAPRHSTLDPVCKPDVLSLSLIPRRHPNLTSVFILILKVTAIPSAVSSQFILRWPATIYPLLNVLSMVIVLLRCRNEPYFTLDLLTKKNTVSEFLLRLLMGVLENIALGSTTKCLYAAGKVFYGKQVQLIHVLDVRGSRDSPMPMFAVS